jgi:FAD:protein FMN transferase
MSLRGKNILYSVILVFVVFAVWLYRKNQAIDPIKIKGKTMGTTYNITYFDTLGRNFTTAVDSLLLVINKSINTYDSTSEVSRFNKSNKGIAFNLPYLKPPLEKSLQVYNYSKGAFDVTVMPLVNAWGFGPQKQNIPDSAAVDSIKSFIGFEKIRLTSDSVIKNDPRVQLDFGGIGQGYAADVITDFLKSKGIKNMLVELGGEGMAIGKNLKTNKPWEIGILNPNSTYQNQFFKAYVSLQDRSFTTSGNYFNYINVDGKKYSHTIDPETGFPAQHAILSASIFADDCATADAWGTAIMVMGHEKGILEMKSHPELDAFLIYTTPSGKMETYVTQGLSEYINIEPNN